MKVLVACEWSGAVGAAFQERGHEVLTCDLLPTARPDVPHFRGDVLPLLSDGWDLLIAFPPCTYLCSSGLHWNSKDPARAEKTEDALRFVSALLDAPVPRIALENPVGCIGTRIRPASQYIQPYQFGHDASKRTGLWLKNLPFLRPTKFIQPRIVECNGRTRERWSNQTDSGQNRLGPSDTRSKERGETYAGVAAAMADQWGVLK